MKQAATMKHLAKAVVYKEHGHPLSVLTIQDVPLSWAQKSTLTPAAGSPSRSGTARSSVDDGPPPVVVAASDAVHIKFLASPINPSDLNQIDGQYPLQPPLPAIGGNEGVAQVMRVGESVRSLQEGDWVVPALPGFGTWRSEALCREADLFKIRNSVDKIAAATLHVNPCSAYRMLEDYVTLQKDDVIVQNGPNSAVGQAVIQIARMKGVKTVDILRDRPNFNEMKQYLESLGSSLVLKDEECGDPGNVAKTILQSLGHLPKLALNCVGGQSATLLARLMGHGGTMVTYGGMSKKPVTIPTGLFIFNDLLFRGFWMSRWYQQQQAEQQAFIESGQKTDSPLTIKRRIMINDLLDSMEQGTFKLATETHPVESFKSAIEKASQPYVQRKQVLLFD